MVCLPAWSKQLEWSVYQYLGKYRFHPIPRLIEYGSNIIYSISYRMTLILFFLIKGNQTPFLDIVILE